MRAGTRAHTLERWIWSIAAFAVAACPLFISRTGYDAFRLPKELLFYGCGILILGFAAAALVWNQLPVPFQPDLRRPEIALPALIVLWTVVTALISTKPVLSAYTVLWVVCSVALFLAIRGPARRRSGWILFIAGCPAIVNALLAMSQQFHIWNPFMREEERTTLMSFTIGLLGNSNDVGMFLIPSVVVAIAAAVAFRRLRALWIACGIVFAGGVGVSQSIASYAAVAAALVAFIFLLPRRARLAIVAAGLIAVLVLFLVPNPIRQRIVTMQRQVRSGQYDTAVSGRLIGSVTAWRMFADHPVAGVGPGAYGYHFFDYVIEARRRSPALLRSDVALTNYHEAHNDHFQILATTGVPGYLIFIAAIVYLGSRSLLTVPPEDERARFARLVSFPLATAFFVSGLAQFPLEIAAPLTAYLFYSAVCTAWLPSQRRPSSV